MKRGVLRDLLRSGLDVVFCGTAVGVTSETLQRYYAAKGNQFWKALAESKLTARKLEPEEFVQLFDYNLGLTDLVKTRSGVDSELESHDYDVKGFKKKIKRFRPRIVAFNGKTAAKIVFDRKITEHGLQPEKLHSSLVFVLPSTSGRAKKDWDIDPWKDLARSLELFRST